jgi:hypothetical protein
MAQGALDNCAIAGFYPWSYWRILFPISCWLGQPFPGSPVHFGVIHCSRDLVCAKMRDVLRHLDPLYLIWSELAIFCDVLDCRNGRPGGWRGGREDGRGEMCWRVGALSEPR